MKRNLTKLISILMSVVIFSVAVFSQTTEFTYQGSLKDGAAAANANYDFEFALFDAVSGGSQIGSTIPKNNVAVANGTFSVKLDFGSNFPGANRYLEIRVRLAGQPGITTLGPPQLVNSAPYSVKSLSSTSADTVNAANISGVLGPLQGGTGIGPAYPVANTYLRSNGSGWTADGIHASDIPGNITVQAGNVIGVVAVANGGTGSPTKNFTDLTTNQTVAGRKTFVDPISGDGSLLTNINGVNITNNTINASALASDTFPNSRNLSLLGSLRWDLLGQRVVTGSPLGIAFDGMNVWATNSANGANSVTKVRVSDGAVLGTFTVGGFSDGAAFDGANIWVTNAADNTVTKLRASDGALQGTFATGSFPNGIAFDGANMWIANSSSNTVTKLRASDGACVNPCTIAVPAAIQVAFDGANIWVSGGTSATKLRASDGANLGTFPVGGSANGVAFDGANIWVVGGNAVTKLRAFDGSNLGSFAVGNSPRGVVFDGTNIWVANNGSGTLTKLRASDGTFLGTFPSVTGPFGVAFDGANVWVTNFSGNNIQKQPVFQ